MSMTEAARLSGNSRQWWLEAEKGLRPPRPEKLARAVLAVGGDLAALFALADYDPTPFLGEISAVVPDLHAVIVAQARQIERLGDLIETLIERLPLPPDDTGR
jgi:hypothetical protein